MRTLQPADRRHLEELVNVFGPESLIEAIKHIKRGLPPFGERRFEAFKLQIDFSLLERGIDLTRPPWRELMASIARVRPGLTEFAHEKLAKRYRRYTGGKRAFIAFARTPVSSQRRITTSTLTPSASGRCIVVSTRAPFG